MPHNIEIKLHRIGVQSCRELHLSGCTEMGSVFNQLRAVVPDADIYRLRLNPPVWTLAEWLMKVRPFKHVLDEDVPELILIWAEQIEQCRKKEKLSL